MLCGSGFHSRNSIHTWMLFFLQKNPVFHRKSFILDWNLQRCQWLLRSHTGLGAREHSPLSMWEGLTESPPPAWKNLPEKHIPIQLAHSFCSTAPELPQPSLTGPTVFKGSGFWEQRGSHNQFAASHFGKPHGRPQNYSHNPFWAKKPQ